MAELLKRESGSAVPDPGAHFQHINVPGEVGFSACSIVASDLSAVINARLDELFTLIRNDLESQALLGQLAAGVVLTGGGCHLREIETLAGGIFDMPCLRGKPRGFSGIASAYEAQEYAAALGLVLHASENAAANQSGKIGGLIKRFFGMRK